MQYVALIVNLIWMIDMGGVCSSEAKVAKRDGNKEVNEVIHSPESPTTSVRATRGKDGEEKRSDDDISAPKPGRAQINPLTMRVGGGGGSIETTSFRPVSSDDPTNDSTRAGSMEQVRQAWSMNTRRDSFIRDLDDSEVTEHGEMDDDEAARRALKRTINLSEERSFATQRVNPVNATQRAEEVRLRKALAMNTPHTALPNVPDNPELADVMSAMGVCRPSSASSSRDK